MVFRGGDKDAAFFHQVTLLDSKRGCSALYLLILSVVNCLKTKIKYDCLTDWHEVFIEDIVGEAFAERKT
jgi:hypothetical protein